MRSLWILPKAGRLKMLNKSISMLILLCLLCVTLATYYSIKFAQWSQKRPLNKEEADIKLSKVKYYLTQERIFSIFSLCLFISFAIAMAIVAFS